jgi:tRNA pseudouridine38-40 synthase
MPRVKLVLEYDGTEFVGWQVQAGGRSVQGVVEGALAELLGEPVRVAAAGRTDSGVHALGQVVAFTAPRALPMKAYSLGLNGHLPPDVAVMSAEEVPEGFDPRRWSLGKRYRYLISNRRGRSPVLRRTHWEVFAALDVESMRAGARALVGRHDFSAFRAADCQAHHAMREVRAVEVAGEAGGVLEVEVEGTAFLKHMVRNIAGTLVEVGKGKQPARWVAEVLKSKDRTQAGPTAPAHGLCLVEVRMGDGPHAAAEGDDDG